MTKRASLTAKEKIALLQKQDHRCAICDGPLGGVYEIDHTIAVALGNSGKPDAAVHRVCHLLKTKADVRIIAKCKRLSGETGKSRRKRPIPSRGFDKRFKRKFDGTTERRA